MDTISRLDQNLSKLNDVRKGAVKFLEGLTDAKSFVETGTFVSGAAFADGVQAEGEGVLTGYATISGVPVYLFVQNFEAMRGSFSAAQAKKIESCMNMAAKSGIPFVSVIDSAGARVSEGVAVLEGYAKLIKLAAGLKNVVPHVAVIKGACTGMLAAYACTADVVIFDEKGYMSLVSPNVVAAKADEKGDVKKIFGADAFMENGVAALKYSDAKELKAEVAEVLTYISGEPVDSDNPNRKANGLSENVTAEAVLAAVADGGKAFELTAGYANVKTYFARVNGVTVGIISANTELAGVDFKKIKKFVNLLDGYSIPLITLVNSDGAAAKLKCELKGLSAVAAEAFTAIALSDNAKIAVITGSAIGLAYSMLCSKAIGFDYTVAFDNASVAPLSAEQAVNFLDIEYKSKNPVAEKEKLVASYTEREGNPFLSAKDGFVDNIISADDVRPYLCSVLGMLL